MSVMSESAVNIYPINEIFCSLQGEGYHTGMSAVFVRFSGCNLRCAWCDTSHQRHTMMSASQILSAVYNQPVTHLIVLTGGEPSLWIDTPLIETLRSSGRRIAIETNGTRPLPDGVDWVTLSPKKGVDGGSREPCILDHCDELKVVYNGQELEQYDTITAAHRFLQPCHTEDAEFNLRNLRECVQAVMRHPQWRLSLQTHRLLGIR